MKITKVELSKARLERMPAAPRRAVLLLGHAYNEINFLRKLLLVAIPHEVPGSKIVDHVQAAQVVIIMRLLLGKLFEAWRMFGKRVQPLRDKYLPSLSDQEKQALSSLGKYFKDERMPHIRNRLAFHYEDKYDLVEKYWRKLPETEPWDFYLSNVSANSFYYASELVVTCVLIQLALPASARATPSKVTEEQVGFEEACRLSIEISGHMLSVFEGIIAAIAIDALPDLAGEEVDIGEPGKLSQLSLPYFWDEVDLLSKRKA